MKLCFLVVFTVFLYTLFINGGFMRIAICDDDTIFLSKTVELIKKWENKPIDLVVQTFDNGDHLIHMQSKDPFDVIILDIVMPMMNGIEVASEIRTFDNHVKIVFLTTSKEFAIDSYSVKASNYLLKPVQADKLYLVLDELVNTYKKESHFITIKGLNATYRIQLMDIEYLESQNKHVRVHLIDGRSLMSTTPLYTFEEELKPFDYFFKCHRSYIINLYCVSSFTTKDILMRSNESIPISRNIRKNFEETYFSVIFAEVGDLK